MKWVKDDKDFIDKCIQEEDEAGRLLAYSRETRCLKCISALLE